jgi:CBS domain-containing protein
MKVSEIMTKDVLTLSPDDTMSKALNIMYTNKINQLPILNEHKKYQGMVFAKDFLNINTIPSSKMKNFVTTIPILNPSDSIKKCIQLIVTTGNRALPVLEDSKLIGIVSETDTILKTDFGNVLVDNVMANAIVVRDDTTLDSALAKMRRYNISRLPVINSNGILTGVINALDRAKIMATPRERIAKDSRTSSIVAAVRQVPVNEITRKMKSVKIGTQLKDIVKFFKMFEEIVVIDEKNRPIGIITPRDALEITLPRRDYPSINIANISDYEVRNIIEDHLGKFLKKIHGKHENILSVLVYGDKYKKNKYSLRARIISTIHVINAKAVGYDPTSVSKKLISILEKRIKIEQGKRIKKKYQRNAKDSLL